MENKLSNLLSFRGVHWLATRFGWKSLRRLSFDEKFKSGDWNFGNETPALVNLVENYSSQGDILVLGCGAAPIANALNPNSYATFLGLDLSEEAIKIASQYANSKVHFEVADMIRYQCLRKYNVILFSDCLNYAPYYYRKKLVERMCGSLTSTGRIIVVLSHPGKYKSIISMIRRYFSIEVDQLLEGTGRHILIFH